MTRTAIGRLGGDAGTRTGGDRCRAGHADLGSGAVRCGAVSGGSNRHTNKRCAVCRDSRRGHVGFGSFTPDRIADPALRPLALDGPDS